MWNWPPTVQRFLTVWEQWIVAWFRHLSPALCSHGMAQPMGCEHCYQTLQTSSWSIGFRIRKTGSRFLEVSRDCLQVQMAPFWACEMVPVFCFKEHPLAKAEECSPTASLWAPGVFLWDTLTSYSKFEILFSLNSPDLILKKIIQVLFRFNMIAFRIFRQVCCLQWMIPWITWDH